MSAMMTEEQLNNVDKAVLIQLILQQQKRLEGLSSELHDVNDKMQKLMEQVVLGNQHRFGRSSEKMSDPGQISFMEADGNIVFFNEAEAACDPEAGDPESLEAPRPKRGKKKTGKRDRDMEGIPVERVDHYLGEEELKQEFGENGWKQMDDAISRKYHFHPAKITVEEHHIGVYASKKDGHMVKAPHPKSLLHGSTSTPSLVAAIINGKYVNAVPLYRMEQEFLRYGLNIPRRNMANWVIRVSEEYLGLLYDRLHQLLYRYHVIQADETPVLVNKDGRPAGAKSYMWVYRSGFMYQKEPIILYEYQRTRNASHPREFLKGFSGICLTDGYEVYHTLDREREDLTIAGCWVHCRRRFSEALGLIPKSAQKGTIAYIALKQIQAIYREEGKLKDLPSEERLIQRKAVIQPLADAFFAYLKQNQSSVSSKLKLGDAFNYALNQEKYLRVFLSDGDVPMDNNASERAIRGFTIGRKNWEMIDTIRGAEASAVIYSLAETAKANNLKPYEYFEHLLTEIPKHMDDTDLSFLDELLPWAKDLPDHIRRPIKKT